MGAQQRLQHGVGAGQVGDEGHETANGQSALDDLKGTVTEDEAGGYLVDGLRQHNANQFVESGHSCLDVAMGYEPLAPASLFVGLGIGGPDGAQTGENLVQIALAGFQQIRLIAVEGLGTAACLARQEVGEGEGEQGQQGKAPVQGSHSGQCANKKDGVHYQWQQMFADVDFADSAAAAGQSMDMFCARKLLELGKADVQQVVEQFLAQTLGDTFTDVDAQVVVGGVETCAEHGRDHRAGEEEADQAYVGCGYGGVEEQFEEVGLNQRDPRADERQCDEERHSGNLLSQFLLEESKGGVRRFGT